MSLSLRIARITRGVSWQAVRTLKTTTTEHPQPVYDQEDKVLEKIIERRKEDLVSPTHK